MSWNVQELESIKMAALTGLPAINDVIRHRRIAVFGHIARIQDITRAHIKPYGLTSTSHSSSSLSLLELSAWSPTWQMDRPNPKRHQPDTCRPMETGPWTRSSWTSDAMAHAGYAMMMMNVSLIILDTENKNFASHLCTPYILSCRNTFLQHLCLLLIKCVFFYVMMTHNSKDNWINFSY